MPSEAAPTAEERPTERTDGLAAHDSALKVSPPSSESVGPHSFEKIRVLGVGSTGRVYLVRSIGFEKEGFYAMKVVKKSELAKKNREQRVLAEKQILSAVRHPFIVSLHFTFQTTDCYYLIMQARTLTCFYCAGGEFFSFLKRQGHRLPETHARFYAAEVLLALEYLHLMGVIYRDLKPENILVHESGHILLSDFDLAHQVQPPLPLKVALVPFSTRSPPSASNPTKPRLQLVDRRRSMIKAASTGDVVRRRLCCARLCIPASLYPVVDTESHLQDGEKRRSFVGTHEYVAPEIIAEDGYAGSVDWWAFGILLYEMVYGHTPFKGSTQTQTLENILDTTEEVEFPADETAPKVSDECKALIRQLLAKDSSQRLQNALYIKAHPFFRSVSWPLIRHEPPPVIPALVHSLKAKEYPRETLDAFDDQVPYARGVVSPRMARQAANKKQVVSSASATALTAPPPATNASTPLSVAISESRTSSSSRTARPSAYASALVSHAPLAEQPVAASRSSHQVLDDGTQVLSSATADSKKAGGTAVKDVTVSFDYSAGPSSPHWSNSESTQSLQTSLFSLVATDAKPLS